LSLVSGTTLAQLITVAASPLTTRLFGPDAFGLYALFGSITTILGVIVCLRYEESIVLPDRNEEAASLLGVCLVFAFLISLLTVPIVWFGAGFVVRLLKAPALGAVLWMVPLMLLVSGIALGFNYWNSRTRHFARLSVARVSATATSTGVQLTGGYIGHGTAVTLVASSLIGSTVSTAILGGQILRQDGHLFRRSMQWNAIWKGMIRHRKFPLYGTASSLLNSLSWQLPSLLLQYYFSATVVGLYALGNAVLRVPMGVIGGAISQVFFQRAAGAHRAGTLAETVEGAFQRLAALSLFPMMILTILGPEIFAFFFGARWAEAGVYAQILAPWTFFWFISSPLSSVFSVLERQEFGLKLNPVILATRFLSLAAGGWLHSARLALVFFAGSGVLVYGYYTFAILEASGLRPSRIGRDLLRAVVEILPAALVLSALKLLGAPAWLDVSAAAAFFLFYALRVVRRDPVILGFLKEMAILRRLGFSDHA